MKQAEEEEGATDTEAERWMVGLFVMISEGGGVRWMTTREG